MKKLLIFLIGFLVASATAGLVILYRWMQTPNGRLHPIMAVTNRWLQANRMPITLDTLAAVRQNMNAVMPHVPIAFEQDVVIDGPGGDLLLRIYKPHENGRLPVIVFFHGGGFALGSIKSHANVARQMANETGAMIISVDYRLAPEHPFPAGLDDCYAATEWAVAHAAEYGGDPVQLAVAGDSAGGNFAATVCLRARDENGPKINLQALFYPSTIMLDDDSPSRHDYVSYVLYEDDLFNFHDWYMAHADDENPYASPLLAEDLSQLPPAYIVTAGMDPLRDQGQAYAKRLQEAGVPVVYHNFEGMMHGFLNMVDARLPGMQRVMNQPKQAYQEMLALWQKSEILMVSRRKT